jgi:hypothetical protein
MQIYSVKAAMKGRAGDSRALILPIVLPPLRQVHYFIIDLLYITLSGEYRTGIDVEGWDDLNIVLLHPLSRKCALHSLINPLDWTVAPLVLIIESKSVETRTNRSFITAKTTARDSTLSWVIQYAFQDSA